jgi:hypothetical protein
MSDSETTSEKERDGVPISSDATRSPILCTKGGEFGPQLKVVWLHTHPLIGGEFALTKSPIGDGESTRTPTHPFAFVIATTFC